MADDFQSKAAEVAKKVLTVGVGALFLTEESLRGLISEFKLPKELISAVLDSANKTKGEFFKTLSHEMMETIAGKVDAKALLQSVLENNEFEFHVKMSLKPKKTETKEGE
ncbi:MAG: hypothetical protein HYX41_06125 [Bdellovibrio sp.]|nr:hypothetical protein [Bdellovibrio sp.]